MKKIVLGLVLLVAMGASAFGDGVPLPPPPGKPPQQPPCKGGGTGSGCGGGGGGGGGFVIVVPLVGTIFVPTSR
jgi:hypothetical protein